MKKVYVVHHTHWDCEWYFTMDQSNIQLNYHLKELLRAIERGQVNKYVLDGQASLIDEFIRLNPNAKKIISEYVKKGNLDIGPWYTQTDQFLVQGESIYQNLKLGMEVLKSLGGTSDTIYVPDSFGQNDEVIDIYKIFNFDKLVFWRGLDPNDVEGTSFEWNNGHSKINARYLPYGYYRGYVMMDQALLKDYIIDYQKLYPDEDIVIPVGGDQRAVDLNLEELIAQYNLEYQDLEFELVSYSDIVSQNNQKVSGELLNGAYSKIHRSIYSTRNDIKLLAHQSEALLINVTTPLMVMADSYGLAYDEQTIKDIWKQLFLCHAHDSICGCNSDATNLDIFNRLTKQLDRINSLNDYIIRKVAEANILEDQLLLVNTLGYNQDKYVEVEISTRLKNFQLFTDDQQEIKYEIISRELINRASISYSNQQEDLFYKTKIRFKLKIEKYSYKILDVVQVKQEVFLPTINQVSNLDINDYSILIKPDVGDSYDYSYPDTYYQTQEIKLSDFNSKDNVYTYDALFNKHLIKLTYQLEDNTYKFKITSDFLQDVKIQLKYNQPLSTNTHLYNGLFTTKTRLNVDKNLATWKADNWKEEPSSIYPMNNAVSIGNDNWLVTNGLKEYEIEDNYVLITLLRSTKYLGRPELTRRPGIASGQEFMWVRTYDEDYLSEFTCEVGIIKASENEINKKVIENNTNYLYYQRQELNRFTGPLKYFTSNIDNHIRLNNHLSKKLNFGLLDIVGIDIVSGNINVRLVNNTHDIIEFEGIKIKVGELINHLIKEKL